MAQNSEKPKKTKKGGPGKPFTPGRSGNPGGRPKTAAFSAEVREYLAEQNGDKTRLRQILEDLQKNDPKILLYYAHGKPVETVDLNQTTTIVGLPEDYLKLFRDDARSL